MEEALFLLQLIGINVFNDTKTVKDDGLIKTIDVKTKLAIGKRAKADAMTFLAEKGITLKNSNTTYAVKTEGKNECWANPQTSLLEEEWDIILNNNLDMELVLLHVPAGTFSLKKGNKAGLVVRTDKPKMIDLRIDLETFVEKRGGLDLSKYVVKKIKY